MQQRYRLGIIVGLWGGVAACGLIADLGPPPDVVPPSEASADATGEASIDAEEASADATGEASIDAADATSEASTDATSEASTDATDATSEASTDATDAALEAAAPVPPDASCNADAPFGDPVPLAFAAGGADNFDARLTIDELTVYLASDQYSGDTSTLKIYSATRAHFTDSFGPPVPVAGINPSGTAQYAPSVTEDGLSLYINKYLPTNPPQAIYLSTRSSQSVPFGAPAPVSTVALGYSEANPMITPDGSTLYFWAQNGTGNHLIYSSVRDTHGVLSAPAPINELNGGDTGNLAVSADQRTILFSTTRGDPTGANADIWISTRAKSTDPWGTPASLPGNVNSPWADAPTWISGDGCRLYLQSNRSGGPYGLYFATRP